MKNFLRRFRTRFQQSMVGRNGYDALSRVVYFIGLGLFILHWFIPRRVLLYFALLFLGYSLFRVFSRNVHARQRENEAFLRRTEKLRSWLRLSKRRWQDRKTHRYFTCPHCHQTVRVPKTVGKIRIHCPKCGESFTARM